MRMHCHNQNKEKKQEIEKGIKLGAEKYLVKAHYPPSEVVTEVKKILKKFQFTNDIPMIRMVK